jgi:periplasmic protein TonB
MRDMKKPLVIILSVAALASSSLVAQSNPSSLKPRHCSIDGKSSVAPQLPDSLKGSGVQGTVLIGAAIGENGCTQSVWVVRKLHPKLDEFAKQTVDSWKFSPATKDGKPVTVMVQIEIKFDKDNVEIVKPKGK